MPKIHGTLSKAQRMILVRRTIDGLKKCTARQIVTFLRTMPQFHDLKQETFQRRVYEDLKELEEIGEICSADPDGDSADPENDRAQRWYGLNARLLEETAVPGVGSLHSAGWDLKVKSYNLLPWTVDVGSWGGNDGPERVGFLTAAGSEFVFASLPVEFVPFNLVVMRGAADDPRHEYTWKYFQSHGKKTALLLINSLQVNRFTAGDAGHAVISVNKDYQTEITDQGSTAGTFAFSPVEEDFATLLYGMAFTPEIPLSYRGFWWENYLASQVEAHRLEPMKPYIFNGPTVVRFGNAAQMIIGTVSKPRANAVRKAMEKWMTPERQNSPNIAHMPTWWEQAKPVKPATKK